MYTISNFCEDIYLQPEIRNDVHYFYNKTDFNEYLDYMSGIMSQKNPFENFVKLSKLIENDERGIKILTVYLECARRCLSNYQKEGIDKKIYIDTMKCFPRFIQEYYQKNGCYGFSCPWWAYRQLNMTIFRLGALEFEFSVSQKELTIGIHIPSDTDFREESINESFHLCRKFIEKHRSEFTEAQFTCHSWLLSPYLKFILEENTNIIRFQNLFDITNVYENEMQYMDYIFHADARTPLQDLRENTSLQKGVKELLKKSINLGAAYGIMKQKEK